jgi:DNA-binding XRE family transcriptional regulator
MNAHTDIQIIKDNHGTPLFAVLPYALYESKFKPETTTYVPSEVAELALLNEWSALRAWREHLGLTQVEVASRLGVTQSAYAQQESSKTLRRSSRLKIAAVLGIESSQLDF